MKSDILFMLRLIASVVLEKEAPEMQNIINWENILRVSVLHNVANLVAYGIAKGRYPIPDGIKNQFDLKLYERMTVSDNQNLETEKILNVFNENNIDHMPLKGILLQNLYPSKDMRFMADMDILIKPEEKEKINSIMLSLGYEFYCESNHEYIYSKKPYVSVELHKRLIPSYNEDMYAYFGEGWDRAIKSEKNRYELNTEDNFIYIFTHFTKHYRDGGIGIKAVLDIFLYLQKYNDINKDYVKEQLEKLKLNEFYDNLTELVDYWFCDGEETETAVIMTEFIINSGTFGNLKNQVSAEAIRESKDIKNADKFRYIKFIFPNLKKMKVIFPTLEKFPILLPFFWAWRVIRFILFKRQDIDKHVRYIESADNESITLYDKHMKQVGLDVYKGRKDG